MTKQVKLTNKAKAFMGIKANALDSKAFFKEVLRVYSVYADGYKAFTEALDQNDFMGEMQATGTAAGVSELYQDYKKWVDMITEARNFFNDRVSAVGETVIEELEKKEGLM